MSYNFAGKRALVTGAGKGEVVWILCNGLAWHDLVQQQGCW